MKDSIPSPTPTAATIEGNNVRHQEISTTQAIGNPKMVGGTIHVHEIKVADDHKKLDQMPSNVLSEINLQTGQVVQLETCVATMSNSIQT